MKRLIPVLICMCLMSSLAVADYEDFYYELSDAFSAFADPNTGLTVFPTLLVPLGGNREGMGTAYTAVASDSGFIEANPAGSAVLDTSEFSFLHHSWIADSQMESIIYTTRFDNLGIGAAAKFLYVPFTEYSSWGLRESKGLFSETILTLNIAYNFFSSYSFFGVAAGANIKAAYRHVPEAIYPGQSAFTGMVDFGLLTRFNLFKFYYSRSKNFSVGAAIKNLGFNALEEPLPTLASAGIAYSPFRPLLIAIDINFPISFNPEQQPAELWYLAAGVNVTLTEFLSIQTGMRLKENPRISLGATLDLESIAFVANYNVDLSGGLNPLDKFSIEAKLKLGDGGRAARRKQIEELYAAGLEAYARGELERAMTNWEKLLELNPQFLPALENLEILKKRMGLQAEMDERQRVGE